MTVTEAKSSKYWSEWLEAMRLEDANMKKRGVWKVIPRSQVPEGRKILKNRWVFKRKTNGVFRARLVAKGYDQVPGVDFQYSFAPVIQDTTTRILMVLMALFNWNAHIMDVQTAFLHDDLEEEIFMELPEGLGYSKSDVGLLIKSIYGLVQAARQWWIKFGSTLVQEEFLRSKIDACLFTKMDDAGFVALALWVDDVLAVGDKKAIEQARQIIKKHYEVKEISEVKDYVGCTLERGKGWVKVTQLCIFDFQAIGAPLSKT